MLYIKINYKYAALLADIGRYIILYNYGGIYHDLKCTSNRKLTNYLLNLDNNITFIGETHPIDTNRTRNTNIISLCLKHPLLNELLRKIKINLLEAYTDKLRDPINMVKIGSGIYNRDVFKKHESKTVIKYLMYPTYINFNDYIHNQLTPIRWQNIYEYIFEYR